MAAGCHNLNLICKARRKAWAGEEGGGEAVVPTPPGLRVQHAEVRQPRYARSFTLSPDLDASRIEANLQDSVLKVTIPRREEAKPRRIDVSIG
ncbi:Hsp20 family protein [Cupriavidus sp. LEh25]|nr:Hsp20 family protein [Cupriavidus sp. LEh25]